MEQTDIDSSQVTGFYREYDFDMELDAQPKRFSYADYEKAIREPYYNFLRETTRQNATYFKSCHRVLDLASGQGFLLDVLRDLEIPAWGVDNEKNLVEICRTRGLNVIEDDLLHFLATTEERFDGVSCNHIIEHLPSEPFVDLVEGVHRVLKPGGVFLLTWPNPRSAGTQFQNFWKDPTHSRFYDGDFVKAVLSFYGFKITESFYDTVKPLAHLSPESMMPSATEQDRSKSSILKKVKNRLRSRLIRLLGLQQTLQEHQQNLHRLEIFDVPVDARLVASRD